MADALSRREEGYELNSIITTPYWLDFPKIQEEMQEDPQLNQIKEIILKNLATKLGYTLRGDLLFYKGKLVLCPTSTLIPALLQEYHSTPTSGHSGFTRT